MLGRFSNALQNAADMLAPPAPLHEDFAYYWKRLMKHYLDVSTNKHVPIELTNIPHHLEQLLKILIQEDVEKRGEGGGRCMEYLLEHNLLDLLATLASADDPPGMREHSLRFITRLLTQIKAPIAAHSTVFQSLQRLVGLCDGSTPSPTEEVEVHFLLCLAAFIRKSPSFIELFTISQSDDDTFSTTPSSQVGKTGKLGSLRNGEIIGSSSTLEEAVRRLGFKGDNRLESTCSSSSSEVEGYFSSHHGFPPPCSHHPPLNNPLFLPSSQFSPTPPLSTSKTITPPSPAFSGRGVIIIPPSLPPFDGGTSLPSSPQSSSTFQPISGSSHTPRPLLGDTFPLLEALLSYINTPDSSIRVKACQGLMLIGSLPSREGTDMSDSTSTSQLPPETSIVNEEDGIGRGEVTDERNREQQCLPPTTTTTLPTPTTSPNNISQPHPWSSSFGPKLASRLANLIKDIPPLTQPDHIDALHVSWCMDIPTSLCVSCKGCRQVAAFLSWFDFCDQILIESHASIRKAISKSIREKFLDEVFTVEYIIVVSNLSLLTKFFKWAVSPILNEVLCDWVMTRELHEQTSVYEILITFWNSGNPDLSLESLRFFEVLLEKGDEEIYEGLMYPNQGNTCSGEEALDPNSAQNGIIKTSFPIKNIIDSLLNIVPFDVRSSGSGSYELYICESQRQYEMMMTNWKESKRRKIKRLSFSENNSNLTLKTAENKKKTKIPFLHSIYEAVSNIPNQDYEVNLQLTAVLSRLALSPVHNLSLLNEIIPHLNIVGESLASSVLQQPNYKTTLSETRSRLLGQIDPNFNWKEDELTSYFESIVVLEELCKELAAIAFVKHKYCC